MFKIRRHPAAPLVIAALHGAFDRSEILSEIERAFTRGLIEPGCDRVTIIDPDVDVLDIPVSDLHDIKSQVARYEQLTPPRDPLFRAGFVATPEVEMFAISIYFALWEVERGPRPDFHVFRDTGSAAAFFGVADLAEVATAMV